MDLLRLILQNTKDIKILKKELICCTSGGESLITASNGLNKDINNDIKLGGTLLQNTTIDTETFFLNIVTTENGVNPLSVNSTDGLALSVISASGAAIEATGLVGLIANSSGNSAITANASAGAPTFKGFGENGTNLYLQSTYSSTNTIEKIVEIVRSSSGTAATDIGLSVAFSNQTDSGFYYVSNELISKLTNAGDGTRTSQFTITGINNALTSDLITLHGDGEAQLNQYGAGSFTGTPAYNLAVTSTGNIIEVAASGGTPAGSNTQIQYNNSGSFGASSDFTWNNTTSTLTLSPSTITPNLISMTGDTSSDDPIGIEWFRTYTGPQVWGGVGLLGSVEWNAWVNMDYIHIEPNVHHYYDATKDAVWQYMSYLGWGVQGVKAGYNNAVGQDVWIQGGSQIPLQVDFIKDGSGDYVTGGNNLWTQRVSIIDGDYTSPTVTLRLDNAQVNWTNLDTMNLKYTTFSNVGGTPFSLDTVSGNIATYKTTGNNTYLIFANEDNNANYVKYRFLKNKAGSYNLGAGTQIVQFDYNGGVGYSGFRATSTVLSGFSNGEYFWNTTNQAGVNADRMVLSEEGYLGIGASPSSPLHVSATTTGTSGYTARIIDSNGSIGSTLVFGWTGAGVDNKYKAFSIDGDGLHLATLPDSLSGAPTPHFTLRNGGNVGIGLVNPSAFLHIKAGTATANTAPIKLTAGTNLTTPEDGAFEYDGTNLYFTTSTGRKTVTLV